jgi:hypothetical protein
VNGAAGARKIQIVKDTTLSRQDRLAGRRLRVGVYVAKEDRVVAERVFEPGADVTLGGDAEAGLVIPGWVGPPLGLFTNGVLLHLEPGMRLHMCHDEGEDRVQGTFEELSARGILFPLRVTVSKLNIKVREGIAVFAGSARVDG